MDPGTLPRGRIARRREAGWYRGRWEMGDRGGRKERRGRGRGKGAPQGFIPSGAAGRDRPRHHNLKTGFERGDALSGRGEHAFQSGYRRSPLPSVPHARANREIVVYRLAALAYSQSTYCTTLLARKQEATTKVNEHRPEEKCRTRDEIPS